MRVAVGAYAFRYPLGGNLSWQLQWLVGFARLGHEVLVLEKATYPDACFDPLAGRNGDDPTTGIAVVSALFDRSGLGGAWCFVDVAGTYHGWDRRRVEAWLATADVLVDLGTHGAWLPEAAGGRCRTALVDGEPGYTQMRRELRASRGEPVATYDRYFTNGAAVPTPAYTGPTAGVAWEAVLNPVVPALLSQQPVPRGAPFTTVMNWQSHDPLVFEGRTWRQKDVEFERFLDLPTRVAGPMEVAVAGRAAPRARLHAAGWKTRDAIDTTRSLDAFLAYVTGSAGEFSVCKEGYVALRTGWFSDRSAAYLAAGRPVVMQDTGFGAFLPTGEGLFAVRDVEEAAAAIDAIATDPARHAARAREIAMEHLDAARVLPAFLDSVGARGAVTGGT